MNIKELKKKFKKEFDDYVVKIDMPHISQKGLAVELKEYNKKVWSWIEKLLKAQENRPMGVSQWRNHGKKYGYWEYFEKEVVEEVVKISGHYWLNRRIGYKNPLIVNKTQFKKIILSSLKK